MSISAVPVIAKVLMDLKLIRRDIGQITLAAGMTDDTIGWIYSLWCLVYQWHI